MDRNRLFLSKDSEIIYIDNCKLPQQYIDGIRFLYNQYKKKKPGVIVNDPSQHSRNTQIALFIKSICHLLDKPILILCPHGTQYDWLELCRTLDLGDDEVVIEIENLYVKKKVFINFMLNISLFTHREWSILVVADDDAPREVLQCHYKAHFKIWSTSVDMKDNLQTFSAIQNWFIHGRPNNQNDKFNINEFMPKNNSVTDIIHKAILVDAFMEDIVLRRKDLDCNFKENNKTISKNKTFKNKDVTGTKIKRSKRKLQDAVKISSGQQILPKVAKPSRTVTDNSCKDVTSTEVELHNNKEVNVTRPEKEMNTDKNASQEMKLIYDSESIQKDNDHETKNLVSNTVKSTDLKSCCEMGQNIANSNEIYDDTIDLYEVFKTKWKLAQVTIQDTEDNNCNMKPDSIILHSDGKTNGDIEKLIQDTEDKNSNMKPDSIILHSDGKTKFHPNNTHSKDLNETKSESEIVINMLSEIKTENNDDDLNTESELEKLLKSDIVPVKRRQVEKNKTINVNTVKPVTNVVSSSVFNDIDSKNERCLEEARKRFKGSVLDSIF